MHQLFVVWTNGLIRLSDLFQFFQLQTLWMSWNNLKSHHIFSFTFALGEYLNQRVQNRIKKLKSICSFLELQVY